MPPRKSPAMRGFFLPYHGETYATPLDFMPVLVIFACAAVCTVPTYLEKK